MKNTTYVPIQIWTGKNKDLMSYEMFHQHFVGNIDAAKQKAAELKKQYSKPEFIVRRQNVIVTIYKK